MWSLPSTDNFASIQVRNPFPAAQSLTPPGHPGAYSVELVCLTLSYHICTLTFAHFHFTDIFYAPVAMKTNACSPLMFTSAFFLPKIYPHRFAGGAGAQVSTHILKKHLQKKKKVLKTPPHCSLLSTDFFSLFSLSAAIWFHENLHSSATRQIQCGSRKCCCFIPSSDK